MALLLAGRELTGNGEGELQWAAATVDVLWLDYTAAALAILKTMREPSGRMLAVRDAGVWGRMIAAAIEDETISES